MQKRQLSPQYRIVAFEDKSGERERSPAEGKKYGLINTASDERILITEAMYLFLEEYKTPKIIEEVALVFAKAFDSSVADVLPIVRRFQEEMIGRGVLLTPKAAERVEVIRPYPPGTLIDGYRIEENLSVNLPVEVYKATRLQDGCPVALKVLRIPRRLSPQWREKWIKKFQKEFEIQRLLSAHPNICRLLELTPTYAALEWVDGVSFRRRLAEGAPADAALRESWLLQILDAYAALHRQNILHGDVHARNILISGHDRLTLIDFDLARRLDGDVSKPKMQGAAPEFIPPEHVRFDAFDLVKGFAGYRSEVWQIGLIAYWIIYGKLPFSGATWQELATNIVNAPICFSEADACGGGVDPKMIKWLKKSLAKNPRNRFSSAIEMNTAFQGLLSSRAFEKAEM